MTAPLRVPAPKGYPRRSLVKRALDQAAIAWTQGRPYAAHRVLADAGYTELWPVFLRTATAWARAHPDRVARVDRVRHRARHAPQ